MGVASVWVFDEAASRYMRMPKVEQPRERPEWGDERAGAAKDFVWHEMDCWFVADDGRRLVIAPAEYQTFWAPLDPAVEESTFDVDTAVAVHFRALYESPSDHSDRN